MKNVFELYNGKLISSSNYMMTQKQNKTTILCKKGTPLMYDDIDTLALYSRYSSKFKGDVLCLGLGFGLLGYNFLEKCNSFTYLEIDNELIELIKPYLPDLNYINADAFTFETDKKYDFIFLDIHGGYTNVFDIEINFLINKYKMFLKNGEIDYLNVKG